MSSVLLPLSHVVPARLGSQNNETARSVLLNSPISKYVSLHLVGGIDLVPLLCVIKQRTSELK